jgi:hypothetical protein
MAFYKNALYISFVFPASIQVRPSCDSSHVQNHKIDILAIVCSHRSFETLLIEIALCSAA